LPRCLKAIAGPLEGSTFVLEGRTILGRGDVDLQVLDDAVSREHVCIMENDSGEVMLIDMSSRNGTFVNDRKVPRHRLLPGDRIGIGASEFVYDELDRSELPEDSVAVTVVSGPALRPTILDMSEEVARIMSRAASSRGAPGEATKPPPADQPTPIESTKDTVVTCVDPLHAEAKQKGWAYCPACGGPV
jgi:pSer/pThr/pTyr-binding forkhead associated (FHA) protein